jgi:hypothetical protein
MSNGDNSNLTYNSFKLNDSKSVAIPEGLVIRKVLINGNKNSEVHGITFYDINGIVLLQAGYTTKGTANDVVFELSEGERLVGIKSKQKNGPGSGSSPRQDDV